MLSNCGLLIHGNSTWDWKYVVPPLPPPPLSLSLSLSLSITFYTYSIQSFSLIPINPSINPVLSHFPSMSHLRVLSYLLARSLNPPLCVILCVYCVRVRACAWACECVCVSLPLFLSPPLFLSLCISAYNLSLEMEHSWMVFMTATVSIAQGPSPFDEEEK